MTFRDRSTDRPLWVWLEGRHREVLALARQHPSWRELLGRGWLEDDLEQEVLIRVWERQVLHKPYDGTRAGFPKYGTLLTGSILANLLGGTRTTKATSEQLGVVVTVDGQTSVVDAALVAEGELLPRLDDHGRAAERLAPRPPKKRRRGR